MRKRLADVKPFAPSNIRNLEKRLRPNWHPSPSRGGEYSHDVPNGAAVFRRIFTRLGGQGRPPQFHVEFYPYAGLKHTIRLEDERAHVRLSDLLRGASLPVLEAAAALLVGRMWRLQPPRQLLDLYHRFSLKPQTRQRIRTVRRRRARSQLRTAGRRHHLRPLFDRLNRRYFGGKLRRPRLGWSVRPWESQLGCFDRALNQIVLNARLDSADVPQIVAEYVLFHEMLHLKHPVKAAYCGFQTHSPSFRREEKRFAFYARARRFLEKMESR